MKTIRLRSEKFWWTVRIAAVLAIGLLGSWQGVAQVGEDKPSDPFLKAGKGKGQGKKQGGGDAEAEPHRFENLVHVLEYIEVPHAAFREWLKKNPGRPDGDALRKEVQGWIDGGDAAMLASHLQLGRSGQRSKVESNREEIYGTENDPVEWMPATPMPVAYETQNVGLETEIDPVLLEDGMIYSNLAPTFYEMLGTFLFRPEPQGSVQPGDIRNPQFQRIAPSSTLKLRPEAWHLVAAETARPAVADDPGQPLDPNRSVLVFVRAATHAFSLPDTGAARDTDTGHLLVEWIEVDEIAATSWTNAEALGDWVGGKVADGDDDSQCARQAAEAEVENGSGEVVFTRLISFKDQQRTKSESIRMITYPTEYDPGEQYQLSNPNAFETRYTGTTVELDPTIHPNAAVVDVAFFAEIVKLVDQNVLHRYQAGEGGDWLPDVVQPVFYSEMVATVAHLPVGESLLVGMVMPPDEEGQPNRARRRLLFLTALP